ncbi:MAG: hypothetical protein AAFV95_06385 [Bacteroidota bacterium]
MTNLSDKISGIELKVRQLALKLERLQNDNVALLNENNQLQADLREERRKKSTAVVPSEPMTVRGGMDVEQKKKLRKEIDLHIKQIDKCIEWLQKS